MLAIAHILDAKGSKTWFLITSFALVLYNLLVCALRLFLIHLCQLKL